MTTKSTNKEREQGVKDLGQEFFEKTYASQTGAIFILDSGVPPKIIDCNPAALQIFGYSRQEILGRTTKFLHVNEAALKKFQDRLYPFVEEQGYFGLTDFRMKRKDGTVFPTEHTVVPLKSEKGVRTGWVSIVRDITERKHLEEALEYANRFLKIANKHSEMKPLLKEFVAELKKFTKCNAIGIRLLDKDGNIPFEAYEGFSKEFYITESPLHIDSDQCMCINVIKGTTDANLPFYTKGGSFFTPSTSGLLTSALNGDMGSTRNVCNQFGYESVALVPIRLGNNLLGLIHIADSCEDMLSFEMIRMLETTAMQLGIAIQRVRAEEGHRRAHGQLEAKVNERTAELLKSNEQLKREIEERKKAEAILDKVRKRLQHVLSTNPTIIYSCSIDPKGKPEDGYPPTYISGNLTMLLGYEAEECLQNPKWWPECLHPEDAPRIWAELPGLFEKGSLVHEYRFRHKDGTYRWVHDELILVYNDEGKPIEFVGSWMDINERKRAEEALYQSESQLRALASRLQEVEEIERKELARELHDQVGQSLTALNINLNVLQNQLSAESLEKAGPRLEDTMRLGEETTKRIRDVMADLRPQVLDDYGLLAALRWYGEQYTKRTAISVTFLGHEISFRLPETVEVALFRVAQEALTNIAKHAEASQATLSFEDREGLLRLTISDNGKGFDAKALISSKDYQGLGLLTMQERTQILGGQFNIESEPGKGTKVMVEIKKVI